MAKTEVKEMEELESAFGEAPESEFDDDGQINFDTTESQEFQDISPEPESKKETEKGKEEKPSETDSEREAWDKERQEIDQAEANYRKANSELTATKTELESQKNLIKTLQDKLSGYAKANEVNIDELDEELVDPNIKRALKSMQLSLDEANSRAESLEKSRDRITQMLQNQEEESTKQKNRAEIIADIEEEFPPKYRNEAIKLANQFCTKRGSAPADRYESAKILRRFYKQVADADKAKSSTSKQATSVATDTGGASSGVVSNEPNKPVTLKEAANQWRKKLRGK